MASAAAESRISSWMQDRIIALVDRSDELIYLSQLRVKYRERYEEELDVKGEGFSSLSHLINAIEGVSVTLRDGKKGTEHLTRTSGDAQQIGPGTCAPQEGGPAIEELTATILTAASQLQQAYEEKDAALKSQRDDIWLLEKQKKKEAATLLKKAKLDAQAKIVEAEAEASKIMSNADSRAKALYSRATETLNEAELSKSRAEAEIFEQRRKAQQEVDQQLSQLKKDILEGRRVKEIEEKNIVERGEATAREIIEAATQQMDTVHKEMAAWKAEEQMISQTHKFDSAKIVLDVGGRKGLATRLSTLTTGAAKDSMLAAMFSGRHCLDQDEKDGSYFIDRNGEHFDKILDFLRDPNRFEVPQGGRVLRELQNDAQYYQLESLMEALAFLPVKSFEPPASPSPSSAPGILAHIRIIMNRGSDAQMIRAMGVPNEAAMKKNCEDALLGQCRNLSQANDWRMQFQIDAGTNTSRRLVLIDLGQSVVAASSLSIDIESNCQIYGAYQTRLGPPKIHCSITAPISEGQRVAAEKTTELNRLDFARSPFRALEKGALSSAYAVSKVLIGITVDWSHMRYYGDQRRLIHTNVQTTLRNIELYGDFRQARKGSDPND